MKEHLRCKLVSKRSPRLQFRRNSKSQLKENQIPQLKENPTPQLKANPESYTIISHFSQNQSRNMQPATNQSRPILESYCRIQDQNNEHQAGRARALSRQKDTPT